jgi:hypothetical protein
MKVYVRQFDRSEVGMTEPVMHALRARGMLVDGWREADRVLVAGDRREAVRDCMTYFEHGKVIDHLGAGDRCEGDAHHYDGTYRLFIERMSHESGGLRLGLGPHAALYVDHVVGPPQVEVAGVSEARPVADAYDLVCCNPVPWGDGGVMLPRSDRRVFQMASGNDRGRVHLYGDPLSIMPRREFLRWLRHADHIYGNSSLLCYEAPIWHDDAHIHQTGLRNSGRPIVRWDMETHGRPSENIIVALEAAT